MKQTLEISIEDNMSMTLQNRKLQILLHVYAHFVCHFCLKLRNKDHIEMKHENDGLLIHMLKKKKASRQVRTQQ